MNSNVAIALLITLSKEMASKKTREEAIKELSWFITAVASDEENTLSCMLIRDACICAAIDASISIISALPSERKEAQL